jgi:hypothetical protein
MIKPAAKNLGLVELYRSLHTAEAVRQLAVTITYRLVPTADTGLLVCCLQGQLGHLLAKLGTHLPPAMLQHLHAARERFC